MAKGRPRKQGRRDSKGKLRPEFARDSGTDRTAAKRDKYGTDGADAIGRAYRMGLLGEDGQKLMNTARTISKSYHATFQGGYKCALGQGGGGVMAFDPDPGSARNRQARLFDSLSTAGPRGTLQSHAFYGLVIEQHPDSGPAWLDRLIEGEGTNTDRDQLNAAVATLQKLAA